MVAAVFGTQLAFPNPREYPRDQEIDLETIERLGAVDPLADPFRPI